MEETTSKAFAAELSQDLKELSRQLKTTRKEAHAAILEHSADLHVAAEHAEVKLAEITKAEGAEITKLRHVLGEFKGVLAMWGGHESDDVFEQEKERIVDAMHTAETAIERLEVEADEQWAESAKELRKGWDLLRDHLETLRLHLAMLAAEAETGLDFDKEETLRKLEKVGDRLAAGEEAHPVRNALASLRHKMATVGHGIHEEFLVLFHAEDDEEEDEGKGD